MKSVTLRIPDMKCDGCVSAVQSALSGMAGIHRADVSLEQKTATVEADDAVTAAELVAAVEEAGYKATVEG